MSITTRFRLVDCLLGGGSKAGFFLLGLTTIRSFSMRC
jgi:hypothetical protein